MHSSDFPAVFHTLFMGQVTGQVQNVLFARGKFILRFFFPTRKIGSTGNFEKPRIKCQLMPNLNKCVSGPNKLKQPLIRSELLALNRDEFNALSPPRV